MRPSHSKISVRSKNRERVRHACSTVVSALELLLQTVKEASGHAGIPGLKTGISGLLVVLDVAKKTYQNSKDVEKLAQHISELIAIIQRSGRGETMSPSMLEKIDRLSMKWHIAANEDVADAINGCIQTIAWSIQNFTVESLLTIEFNLDEHVKFVKVATTRIEEKIDSGFQKLNVRLDIKDGRLPYAVFAQFDYKSRCRCLEGTRTDILSQIYRWMDGDGQRLPNGNNEQRSSHPAITNASGPQMQCIFWINGSAGTGKTTIASTVAERCKARGILGASFFCSRDDAECSNPNLIFTTIANQLGQFCPLFNAEVARVVKLKPDIGYSSVAHQLEELIVKPLRAINKALLDCVVVVDALDECKDSGATSLILSSLSRFVDEIRPLKILITSRPEPQLTSVFQSSGLNPATQRLVLHEVALGVVEHDIELYLTDDLHRIGEIYRLEDSWASKDQISVLVKLSYGLFIFASTATRYIEDQNFCDPSRQLAALLSNDASAMAESPSSPHRHLDGLYSQVLLKAFPNISSHLAGRLKMVLGTVILLRDPLTPLALERLLNLSSNTVQTTLARLHSVIIVPEDDGAVIRLLHPSFFDFMTDPKRCLDSRFFVNAKTQHTMLAHACLDVLCSLKRDMCDIRDPSMFNSEVSDLRGRIMRNVPLHVRYACRHWSFHLENAMISDILLDRMKTFCSKFLLNWIEACSLFEELGDAIVALDSARQVLAVIDKKVPDILTLLQDCEQFTLENFSVLSICPLQVYESALLFTPRQAILHAKYGHERRLPIKVCNAPEETWDPCIRTIIGHANAVMSIAISPDGTRILSGSHDMTLRLWDAVTGAHLNTFQGHTDIIVSVAFSSDGVRVLSAAHDKTVRIWNTTSGAQLIALTGHTNGVYSAAFSPDGMRVASVSCDDTLRIWDAVNGAQLKSLKLPDTPSWTITFSPDGRRLATGVHNALQLCDAFSGTHLKMLKGHTDSVSSVAFSPDGKRLGSASLDSTIRLWDAISGSHVRTLKGHRSCVRSVAFSHDGMRIVSGSDNQEIRIWDALSGVHLNTLKGHSARVRAVTFSPDGTRIVSGSSDRTIRLWNSLGNTEVNAFRGHSDMVLSIACSSDGKRIASGSFDNKVRLWDAITGAHLLALEGHTNGITSITFSTNGKYIMSGFADHTSRLWDAVSYNHLHTLTGHHGIVSATAFSPDGTRVISGSNDTTLRLWDTSSGTYLHMLSGHLAGIRSIACSPDGTRTISGSNDCTIRLWDTVSGDHLITFEGHSHPIVSMAFSPDGMHIVSGSEDNTLRVWDAVTGIHLTTVEEFPELVSWVAGSLIKAQSQSLIRDITASAIQDAPGYIVDGEWIVSANRKRRVCWLPVSCRPYCNNYNGTRTFIYCRDSNGARLFIGPINGRVVLVDCTEVGTYLKDR